MEIGSIRATIKKTLSRIAAEQGKTVAEIEGHMALVDELGFSSLDLAAVTASLDTELGVDPFFDDPSAITELITVDDLCRIYARSLSARIPAKNA